MSWCLGGYMKALTSVLALMGSVVILTACSSTARYSSATESSKNDDYVYVIEYEKISRIEHFARNSASNLTTVWVNPPIKRIKRSDLDKPQSRQ